MNRRTDRYGGPLENRARLLFDIVAGIRGHCGAGFIVAVRLSPERFGMRLAEMRTVAQRLLREGQIDLLDMSLWDVFKEPQEEEFQGRSLLSCFTELDRGAVPLAVAGKIESGRDAVRCLEDGADVIVVGRAAILHPDFPQRVAEDPEFEAVALPVPPTTCGGTAWARPSSASCGTAGNSCRSRRGRGWELGAGSRRGTG